MEEHPMNWLHCFFVAALLALNTLGWTGNPAQCECMEVMNTVNANGTTVEIASCQAHQHNSVLIVDDTSIPLDIQIPQPSICYDPDHDMLWITSNTSHHTQLRAISMTELKTAAHNSDTQTAIHRMTTQQLEDTPRNCTIQYDNGLVLTDPDGNEHLFQIDGKGNIFRQN